MDGPWNPSIIRSPENSYVIKNQPASLECKATFADKVAFKCNDEWVSENDQETSKGVSLNNAPYLETRIQIGRREVEEFFGKDGFICECFVFANSKQVLKSDPVKIQIAHLRKHFEREPISDRKPFGSTVQLSCLPPEGEPKPEVFWLKNDKEIEPKLDKNVILAHDGSLIIAVARISDTGDYVCGARNVVSQRLSQTAALTIYVDGKWSEWGSWSDDCLFVDCTKMPPMQTRNRQCTKPAPLNGGRFCEGESEEIRECQVDCPGSKWSPWSACTEDCRQFRQRPCESSSTVEKPCVGFEKVQRQCCSPTSVQTLPSPSVVEDSFATKIMLTAGLGAAIFVSLVAMVVLITYLMRRKSGDPKSGRYSNGTQSCQVRSELLYDVPDSVESNHSHQSLLTSAIKSNANYYIDTPEDDYEIIEETENDTHFYRIGLDYNAKNLVTQIFCSAKFDLEGGRLVLPNSGVKICVPFGAVETNEIVEISLVISDDHPRLPDNFHTLISPTVICHPENVVFKKPLILTIPHSARICAEWEICLYEKSNGDQWALSTVVGKETLNTPCFCQVENNCVYVMTEYLRKFALIGRKTIGNSGKIRKRTRILTTVDESRLKLHFVADVPANVFYLISKEQNSGGRLVSDQEQIFDAQDNNENVEISLETGNKIVLVQRQISFQHVWNSSVFGVTVNFPLSSDYTSHRFVIGQKNEPISVKLFTKNEFPQITTEETNYFELPREKLDKIASLLNPATKQGNDWRMLAKLLRVDHYLPYFASRSSPSELILHLWEAKTCNYDDLKQLWKFLYAMNRLDACQVLNDLLENYQ